MSSDAGLEGRILESLEGLLQAIRLEQRDDDRFCVVGEPERFDRIFGGQALAQSLVAAGATVSGKEPHSLHAYFVEGGVPDEPVDLVVERVRDGRSMATRRVALSQGDRTLLVALVSFHANRPEPQVAVAAPPVSPPDELPTLQAWVRDDRSRLWVDQPPPLDFRIGEAPSFMDEPSDGARRSHWMRLPRDIGDDPLLHAALLTYASDYLLLDMAFRSHPERDGPYSLRGFSLDHAIWLHRPTRFDRWHLHTQETVAIGGDRGLIRGAIHDDAGHLVATVMQEVLVRPNAEESRAR